MRQDSLLSILLYILSTYSLIACFSCRDQSTVHTKPPPLYNEPTTQPVVYGGYDRDPWGNKTRPLLNAFGDTLLTGVARPVRGKVLYCDSIREPAQIRAGNPQAVDIALPYQERLPTTRTRKDISQLGTTNPIPSFVLVNSRGDTIPTGKEFEVFERKVISRQPEAIPVSALYMKEQAAQNIQCLDVDQGMINSIVTSIAQDSAGALWFGTYVGGACRYDGSSLLVYRVPDGLTNDYVSTVLVARNGDIWFGTHGRGISRYDGQRFYSLSENEGLPGNFINCLREDSHGNIWIGTRGTGACRYTPPTDTFPGRLLCYSLCEGLTALTITDIIEDTYGNVWLASSQQGIFQLTPQAAISRAGFRHLGKQEGLPEEAVSSLYAGIHQELWIGLRASGICRFDGNSVTHYQLTDNILGNRITTITGDTYGNLWTGTLGDGAYHFDGTHFSHIGNDDGLPSNAVKSLFLDTSGNLWIGTNGSGVCRYRQSSIRHLIGKDDFTQYHPAAIHADRTGNVWIGTAGNGVIKYIPSPGADQGQYVLYSTLTGLPDDNILSLGEDSVGNIWIGSRSGATMFDGTYFTTYTAQTGLPDNDIRAMCTDHDGNLWFGTGNGGIACLTALNTNASRRFIHYTTREGLPSAFVRTIYEDSDDMLWLGSMGSGVTMFARNEGNDSGTFTHLMPRDGLTSEYVNSIIEDKSGRLWLGTGVGVCCYDIADNTFTYYLEKEGLSNHYVRAVFLNQEGDLWATTARGINVIPAQTTSPQRTATFSLGRSDGLKGLEYDFGSGCIDLHGYLWLGSDKCVEVVPPGASYCSLSPPLPVLRRIDIDNRFNDFRHLSDSLRNTIQYSSVMSFENYPEGLSLPFSKNHVTFYYSAVNWHSPTKVQYSYLMEGQDQRWSAPSADIKAEYRNLSAGLHTFRLCAIGSSQEWSEPLSYSFTIMSPWWRRWWAYVAYIILLSSVVYRIYQFQLSRKLALSEQQRLKELDNLKNRLFTNITHEFRTPLTLIHGPLSHALNTRAPLAETDIKSMYQQSRRLQQLITQMLDLQKVEAGRLQPNYVHGDVVAFIQYLYEAFDSYARDKNVALTFSARPESILTDYDEDKLTKIVSNLVSNAIRHTPDGGNVSVSASVDEVGDTLCIQIRDSGVGINAQELPFIFDRYYQSSRAAHGGTGIGLALAKSMIELLRGSISVESNIDAGTSFNITLPITHHSRDIKPANMSGGSLIPASVDDEIRFSSSVEEISDKPIILVIEDHADVAQFIVTCLKKEFRTIVAADGNAGIQKALEHVPDLIISDVMMPVKDGFELCATVKKDIQTSHIPVILLTGRGDHAALMEGIEHGADAYVVKPFEPAELLLRVRKLLELRITLREYYRRPGDAVNRSTQNQISLKEHAFLEKIRLFIEEHIADPELNMHALCQHMAMSHPQLHRKITALTGESTGKFVRSIRLRKAKDLLKQSDLTISEIAYETGFSEPGYFTKVFSKEFEMTPSEFRSR